MPIGPGVFPQVLNYGDSSEIDLEERHLHKIWGIIWC